MPSGRAFDPLITLGEEVVADKGYHSRAKVRELTEAGFRTYISEPDRPPQQWIDQRPECTAIADAFGGREANACYAHAASGSIGRTSANEVIRHVVGEIAL